MPGHLFTEYFLTDGIRQTTERQSQRPAFAAFRDEARVDALYFHLYGLDREDAAYILSTFPIIQRHDESAFGHYRTKALILAYMNALGTGDTRTKVAL